MLVCLISISIESTEAPSEQLQNYVKLSSKRLLKDLETELISQFDNFGLYMESFETLLPKTLLLPPGEDCIGTLDYLFSCNYGGRSNFDFCDALKELEPFEAENIKACLFKRCQQEVDFLNSILETESSISSKDGKIKIAQTVDFLPTADMIEVCIKPVRS